MDVKIKTKGFWLAGEVSDLARQMFGVAVECSTEDGRVVVHPRPRALTAGELAQLRAALSAAKPTAVERLAEAEAAAVAREARIAAFRAKARTGQVPLADLVDVVSALVGD